MSFSNYIERWIVRSIGDKDDLVSWIVLFEERGDVFSQAIFQTAAGSNHGSKWSEIRKRTRSFASHVGGEAKTAAKRKNAQPDDDRGKEIESQHHALTRLARAASFVDQRLFILRKKGR